MSEFGNGGERSAHLLQARMSKIDSERPNPGQSGGGRHLTHVSPRVLLLDRLIGNFLERVLVCVFVILLLLLFSGCLLVAFLAELATTLAGSHLGVRGHRQYRDHRSDHEGSHLGDSHGQETHGKLTFELWQIPHLDFQNRPPGSETACLPRARIPENNVEGVYAAFRRPKIRRALLACTHRQRRRRSTPAIVSSRPSCSCS